jgi:hypothetical protein
LSGNEVALGEIDSTVEFLFRQHVIGLGLLELCAWNRGIERHQRHAFRDALALLERNRADPSGAFRPQRNRFIGAKAADRRDDLRNGGCHDLDRLDRNNGRLALAGAPFDRTLRCTAGTSARLHRRSRLLSAEPIATCRGAEDAHDNNGSNDGFVHLMVIG